MGNNLRRLRAVGAAAVFLGGIFLCAPARAGIVVGDSLEWLAVRSDDIAVVEVLRSVDKIPAEWAALTVQRRDILRGKFPDSVQFDWYQGNSSRPKKGDLFLLFSNGTDGGYDAVRLTPPATSGFRAPFTVDFQLIAKKEDILATVRRRLEISKTQRPAGVISLEVPENSPAFKALWSGSVCFLRVPADPSMKFNFLQDLKAKDWEKRQKAVYRLHLFPGPDTAAALRPLLADPATQEITYAQEKKSVTYTVYPVRQAVYHVLKMWAQDVAEPEGYRPDVDNSFFAQ